MTNNKWIASLLLGLLMCMQGIAMAETSIVLIPVSGRDVITIWNEVYQETDHLTLPEENLDRFEADVADGRVLVEKEEALAIALEYMVIEYNVAYDELASFTPFISYPLGQWQFDIVPPDAEVAYEIRVDPATGEVVNAYYGAGVG